MQSHMSELSSLIRPLGVVFADSVSIAVLCHLCPWESAVYKVNSYEMSGQ